MKYTWKIISAFMCLLVIFSALSIGAEAAAVTVSATKNVTATTTSGSVTLSWKKVSKATGYRVFQRVDGKWKKVKTLKGTICTIDELTASESYKFAVRTYRKYQGKTYWSKTYTTVTAKTKAMEKPSKPKATSTKNSVTLKWNVVEGATGYRVFQYKSGKWVKIKDVKTNKLTVKSLKSATSYKFRIRPYAKITKKTVWGSVSATVTIKTVDPTQVKITSKSVATNSVTLKWSAVDGAKGYRVSVLKNGKWQKVKGTTALQYKITGLKAGTKYTFRVTAYKTVNSKVKWFTPSVNCVVTTKKAQTIVEDTTKPTTTKPTTTTPTTTKPTTTKPTTTKPTTTKPTTTKPTTTKPTTTKPTTTKPTTTKPTTTKPTTTKPTTTKPTTTKPTTTKPTTTKPTTTKPTTTKPTTTKPTTTKPTTTKPTTTKPTTTKPTTTKPTTTKPTTTKPTTTKPTTTKPTTTKPTTTKPITTKPTTTQPTTQEELKVYRVAKYKEILSKDTLYFKIVAKEGDEQAEIQYARKNGNKFVSATDSSITAKMYYEKATDKMFAYFLIFYYEVPKAEWDDMNIDEPAEKMEIKNVGNIVASRTTFNGKSVICESFIDTEYGYVMKYYFDGDTLVGIQQVYRGTIKQTIYVEKVSNTVSDSLVTRPTKGYVDFSESA